MSKSSQEGIKTKRMLYSDLLSLGQFRLLEVKPRPLSLQHGVPELIQILNPNWNLNY